MLHCCEGESKIGGLCAKEEERSEHLNVEKVGGAGRRRAVNQDPMPGRDPTMGELLAAKDGVVQGHMNCLRGILRWKGGRGFSCRRLILHGVVRAKPGQMDGREYYSASVFAATMGLGCKTKCLFNFPLSSSII